MNRGPWRVPGVWQKGGGEPEGQPRWSPKCPSAVSLVEIEGFVSADPTTHEFGSDPVLQMLLM